MAPEAPTAPDALQVEILRESERVLDRQIDTLVELDRKTERMIALGVAALGAEVGAFVYAVERLGAASPGWRAAVIGSILLTMAGILLFVNAYMGLWDRAPPRGGPAPHWLAAKTNDAAWSPPEHHVAVTAALSEQHALNDLSIAKDARHRRAGLLIVLVGVSLHTGAAL